MLKPFYTAGIIEVGCDEAGRGCLAGPVFAAAVILPQNFNHPQLNDSKKLSSKQRVYLRSIILENALDYSIQSLPNEEIDKLNILNASIQAMHNAIKGLHKAIPEFILVDGNRFRSYSGISHKCIVKGDGIYTAIAAASILAKTSRDEYMIQLHEEFPHYGWNVNKGYPTKLHREAIKKHGITPYHRLSYKLPTKQLKLFDY